MKSHRMVSNWIAAAVTRTLVGVATAGVIVATLPDGRLDAQVLPPTIIPGSNLMTQDERLLEQLLQPPHTVHRVQTAPPKLLRFAQRMMEVNYGPGTRQLSEEQWRSIDPELDAADLRRDGVVTDHELALYIANYGQRRSLRSVASLAASQASPLDPARQAGDPETRADDAEDDPASDGVDGPPLPRATSRDEGAVTADPGARYVVAPQRLPSGVPSWFIERDRDGDGQLTLREFAENPTMEDIREFQRWDLNGDGIITVEEVLRAQRARGDRR